MSEHKLLHEVDCLLGNYPFDNDDANRVLDIVGELEDQNNRLTSRGFEDLHREIYTLKEDAKAFKKEIREQIWGSTLNGTVKGDEILRVTGWEKGRDGLGPVVGGKASVKGGLHGDTFYDYGFESPLHEPSTQRVINNDKSWAMCVQPDDILKCKDGECCNPEPSDEKTEFPTVGWYEGGYDGGGNYKHHGYAGRAPYGARPDFMTPGGLNATPDPAIQNEACPNYFFGPALNTPDAHREWRRAHETPAGPLAEELISLMKELIDILHTGGA